MAISPSFPLPIASGLSDSRFQEKMRTAGLSRLHAQAVTTLQINVGKRCNQACKHCHVDAGPNRTEEMDRDIVDLCLDVLNRYPEISTVDITGGAPELNPHFRYLAAGARSLGRHVIDRCNLTILFEPGQEGLLDFLAANQIEVTASLPYYLGERTDNQRGVGVFEKSIAGLRLLNKAGYGKPDSGLVLNLIYNPTGAFLPPDQVAIERDYRKELDARYGIVFNQLFTITNMPIARFRHFLERTGGYDRYMKRLADAFNPATVDHVMCRSLVSVSHDGFLYDCDFNQMLDLPIGGNAVHIRDFDAYALAKRDIVVGDHCLGCTAGAGSSCGGTVV